MQVSESSRVVEEISKTTGSQVSSGMDNAKQKPKLPATGRKRSSGRTTSSRKKGRIEGYGLYNDLDSGVTLEKVISYSFSVKIL